MEKLNPEKTNHWTVEQADHFYEQLLVKALEQIPDTGAAMVLGPMFILRSPEANFKIFADKQAEISAQGKAVFDQVPFTDYMLKTAPFKYDRKFEIFYQGLIKSGKIKEIHLLPDWEQSEGTRTEVLFAKEMNLPIFYPESE